MLYAATELMLAASKKLCTQCIHRHQVRSCLTLCVCLCLSLLLEVCFPPFLLMASNLLGCQQMHQLLQWICCLLLGAIVSLTKRCHNVGCVKACMFRCPRGMQTSEGNDQQLPEITVLETSIPVVVIALPHLQMSQLMRLVRPERLHTLPAMR